MTDVVLAAVVHVVLRIFGISFYSDKTRRGLVWYGGGGGVEPMNGRVRKADEPVDERVLLDLFTSHCL